MISTSVTFSTSSPVLSLYANFAFSSITEYLGVGGFSKVYKYKGDLENKAVKKIFADPKTMGVNIDKNEYYEIILSNSAHPEDIKRID